MLQKYTRNMLEELNTFILNNRYRRSDQVSHLLKLYQACLVLMGLCHGLFMIYFRLSQNTSQRQVLESSAALKSLEEKKPNQLS